MTQREALLEVQRITESNYDDADSKKLLLKIKEVVADLGLSGIEELKDLEKLELGADASELVRLLGSCGVLHMHAPVGTQDYHLITQEMWEKVVHLGSKISELNRVTTEVSE